MEGGKLKPIRSSFCSGGPTIFAMTDTIAERARKIGGTTIRSIGDIARNQRLKDNNKDSLGAHEMIAELCDDNQQLTRFLRATHEICARHNDVATEKARSRGPILWPSQ